VETRRWATKRHTSGTARTGSVDPDATPSPVAEATVTGVCQAGQNLVAPLVRIIVQVIEHELIILKSGV